MPSWSRSVALLVVGAAAYGFSVGAQHDLLYASRNLVKFPLLLIGTATVCAAGFAVLAATIGTGDPEARRPALAHTIAVRVACGWFRDTAILLGSFAPINAFLAVVAIHTDDGVVGDYDTFLGLNAVFVAVAGTSALVRQAVSVLPRLGVRRVRAAATTAAWLVLTGVVGGQLAFTIRPLVGLPASRGQTPPWFLGTTPDARGATNVFEMVGQLVTRPSLTWPERGR